jgi:hypothetical protein
MRIRNAGPSPDERKGAASQAMKTGSGSPPEKDKSAAWFSGGSNPSGRTFSEIFDFSDS